MVLRHAVQFLDQLLAPLFGQGRYRQPDDLAVVARVQPQIAGADHLLDQSDLGHVPRLDGDQVRFRDVQVGNLIEWRRRTVVVHPKVIQDAQRRSSGANRGHFVLQVRERFFHPGLDARLDFFHRVEHGTAGCCMLFCLHSEVSP